MTEDLDTPLTRRDLAKGDIAKAFRDGSPEVPMLNGLVQFENVGQLLDVAKALSLAGSYLPPFLRGNAGACIAVLLQALQWRFDPVAVARNSYEVTDAGGNTSIGYTAQLLHALVEARAPLRHRLRFEFNGEGQDRQCTVTGTFIGEDRPCTYTTPKLSKITPKRSPLWSSDPDQQLTYYASRAWARRHCPEVLMGCYTTEELRDQPIDVTPASPQHAFVEPPAPTPAEAALSERLNSAQAAGSSTEGFSEEHVAQTQQPPDRPEEPAGEISPPAATQVADKPGNRKPAPDPVEILSPKTSASAKKPPKPPKPPKTAAEYEKWVEAWVAGCTAEEEIEDRWKREMKLRNTCFVTSEAKATIRARHIDRRISELRAG